MGKQRSSTPLMDLLDKREAEIEKLVEMLEEAMEWNWLVDDVSMEHAADVSRSKGQALIAKHRGKGTPTNDNEGWNIIELMIPDYGTIHLGFKGDRIRIRKAGRNPLVPVDFTFDRKNETENIQEIISLRHDVL